MVVILSAEFYRLIYQCFLKRSAGFKTLLKLNRACSRVNFQFLFFDIMGPLSEKE